MKYRYWKLAAVMILVGVMFCVAAYAAKAGEVEREVTQAEVPAAALATLKKLAAGAEFTEFAEEIKHGHTFYEGSWKAPSGGNVDVVVTPAGDLVEIEEEVGADQVPAAVRAVARKAAGEGPQLTFEKKTMILYEVKFRKADSRYELLLTPDGRRVEEEVEKSKPKDDDKGVKDEDEEGEEDEEMEWSFDEDRVGAVPQGWSIAETKGQGKIATWEVIRDDTAPSKPQAIAVTDTENWGHTFNLLMAKQTKFKNLEIAVMVKAISGEEDQGGGPIWRAKDHNNYYISRWNPLEENFRVYFVKNGRRRQLGTANVKTDPRTWHEIEIQHQGNRIEAKFDGKKLIEVEDSTFLEAGMVGLWTKADAATAFDDFEVEIENEDSELPGPRK